MARPKTGDKRSAILQAATVTIASNGLGASTASIAKAAGVGEGSLFRYFADKDELLNELYRELKNNMRHAMTSGFPAEAALKVRARHIWDSYVSWGMDSPDKRKTMAQLSVSDRVLERIRQEGQAGFDGISATMQQIVDRGKLCALPPRFVNDLLLSMAETTMAAMANEPRKAERYRAAGFEAFWSAAAKK
ncbi:MAG: TetR/AcrR family transcriptional regulator [Acidobacteriaceae bacterium]|nr:TetR/AcrR family transcriptional regulator [Acidobacteriaceae bacterium]